LVVVSEISIRNLTPVVVVAGIVEGSVDSEICIEVAHVIGDDVYHDEDASFVTGINQIDEIFFGAEVVVEFVNVSGPISVISSVAVVDDRGNPDGIEAHAVDIVQIVDDSSIASTAIFPYLTTSIPRLSQEFFCPSLRAKRSVNS
jgi:hypothetical protein